MATEARREELVDEFERSIGPLLFAFAASLPLGLVFVAVSGEFGAARVVGAVVAWALYGVVLFAVSTVVVRWLGRLPRPALVWEVLVGVGALGAIRNASEAGPLVAGPLGAAITLAMGLAVELVRWVLRRRRVRRAAGPTT